MLTGNNTISLCESSMKNAVQHYFDTVLFQEGRSPKVVSVRLETSAPSTRTFEILIRERSVAAEESDG